MFVGGGRGFSAGIAFVRLGVGQAGALRMSGCFKVNGLK